MPRQGEAGPTTQDNFELDQPASHHNSSDVDAKSGRESTESVDFAFLAKQTFGDIELERELLALFVAQVRRIVPTLPGLSARQQADTAHLLKGSARGIGAWAAAEAAAAYETATPAVRAEAYVTLVEMFAAAEARIDIHLFGRMP